MSRVDQMLAAMRKKADPKPAEPPPSMHYSDNVITDNRLRMLAGFPPIQRGYYPGDDRGKATGPRAERNETGAPLPDGKVQKIDPGANGSVPAPCAGVGGKAATNQTKEIP